MRLIRFGEPGAEKPGLLDAAGQARDCSGWYADWNAATLRADALADLADRLGAVADLPRVAEGLRLGAPVARPGKVICIGLNYRDHAEESGMPVPEEPVLFMKAPNTVVGPNDTIRIPRDSGKTDWEVELGVVLGRDLSYAADEAEAARAIAGYCISHDVSERAYQLERGGQWVKGKSCDTFNPTGPWLVTPDDVPDPQSLELELDVNGEARQRGTTATMVFGVYQLVHYISQFMTLEAGDLITTGTPPGVGLGMKPPQYLKPGDRVRLAITGLGEQQAVCAATP